MNRGNEELTPTYRSLTQIIVESLRHGIFEGEYKPGVRLNIADLAQKFGASPVPVREALRNLETEGLIDFRLNRGVIVKDLSTSSVRELFMMRSPLEGLAAAEAARLATPEEIEVLEPLVAKMENHIGTDAWHQTHRLFHEQLYAISHLPRLIQLVTTLRGQMRPYSKIYLQDREHVLQAQKEHRQMLDCLREHDEERIRRIVHAHLERPARIAMAVFNKRDSESKTKMPVGENGASQGRRRTVPS